MPQVTSLLNLFFLTLCLLILGPVSSYTQWQQGLTVVAPPKPISQSAFTTIKNLGADWVAFVPYAFTKKNSHSLRYNLDWQWWGERKDGIAACIRMAQNEDLHVMLKPQVYIPGSWPGGLSFANRVEEGRQWKNDYKAYILDFAQLAETYCAEQFCIGTEFKLLVKEDPAYWRELIDEVKQIYSGQLTYSANWDNYKNIPFWNDLDFIGISAYFPLIKHETPQIEHVIKAWKPIVKELNQYSKTVGKPIVFTEYGYLSVDGTAWRNWELEPQINSLNINEAAQANALEALYMTFENNPAWKGGFLWKWFPEGQGHEGYFNKDYTPQGKLGEKVLERYFKK